MRLSPDEIIFWQHGFLKLNATIVFTWGLMFVLAVGSNSIRANFPWVCSVPAGRISWKSSSPPSRNKLERSACDSLRNILDFSVPLPVCRDREPLHHHSRLWPPSGSLSTTAALAICVFVAVPLFGTEDQRAGGFSEHT